MAQEFRATISGRVLDASGSAVPNAKVQATNVATNEVSTATTEPSGTYSIPFLRPGQYKIQATAAGFKQYNRENITIQVGQIAGIEIVLEVGAVTDSVNVTAETAILETQTASRAGIINSQAIAELPLNARPSRASPSVEPRFGSARSTTARSPNGRSTAASRAAMNS
jgi:hypothetical protein